MPSIVPVSPVDWVGARRIIRSLYPPVDLFPRSMQIRKTGPLLIAAEQKTNPRLMETIGALDLVPAARRAFPGQGRATSWRPSAHVTPGAAEPVQHWCL